MRPEQVVESHEFLADAIPRMMQHILEHETGLQLHAPVAEHEQRTTPSEVKPVKDPEQKLFELIIQDVKLLLEEEGTRRAWFVRS